MPCLLPAAVFFAVFAVPAVAQKPTDNDKLPGEVWTFETAKGELSRKGEFRVYQGKVFHGERNLGTVAVKGDEATLVIRGFPPIGGRTVVKREPGGWRGVLHHNDGSKWTIVLRVKETKQPPKERKGKDKKP